MSFDIAKKDSEFWNAYYENSDERYYFNDESLTPEEFYQKWIDRDKYEKTIYNKNKGVDNES